MKLLLSLLPVVAALGGCWCLLAMQRERRAAIARLHAEYEQRVRRMYLDHGLAIRNLYAFAGATAPAKYNEPPYAEEKEPP